MNRIYEEFLELAAFSVPSKHESEIRRCLKQKLLALGFAVSEDDAFAENDSGNLYGWLDGTLELPPILFTAHMDTVTPCENKKITMDPDGRIHTDETTILGGDDLTGVVEFLAAIRFLEEQQLPHRPIEVIFTACEEYFVQGAERLDYSRIRSREAYILDTDGEIGRAVLAAPTGIRIVADIKGRAAHAALAPEDGINAIVAAAQGISRMKLGRIDPDTTANIGIVKGGSSGNIVPETCFVEGETRSLKHESALQQCQHMIDCLKQGAEACGAECDARFNIVYRAWAVEEADPLCIRFRDAALKHGLKPFFEPACGGSDASMMSSHDIRGLVLATGMHEIHSVREYTSLQEMEKMTEVLVSIMTAQN